MRVQAEQELRRIIGEPRPGEPFKLRCAGFKGSGRQPEFADASWERLRDTVYRSQSADRRVLDL